MKKLKSCICLVAVLLVSTQALTAQTAPVTGSFADPASATSVSTFGRFRNDVDRYFHVNDWVDVQYNKWFSFLQASEIKADGVNTWEAGLALQLPKDVHLGLYYKGRYNSGQRTDDRTMTIDDTANGGTITRIGPDFGALDLTDGTGPITGGGGAIEHRNYFGVLLGVGNHGFRLTVEDNLNNIDLPYVYTSAFHPAADQTEIDAGAKNFQDIPAGTEGSYRRHDGYIKPSIMWGAAKPMNFGKYSSKPNVRLDLTIVYDESFELYGLTTPDGVALDDIRYYNNNKLAPLLVIDSNRVGIWSGDWGSIGFGAFNEFGFVITDDGKDGMDSWSDKLNPYAIFTYTPADYLAMALRLDVPFYFGWNRGADTTYFGIGSRGGGINIPGLNGDPASTSAIGDLPLLRIGFQLQGGFFDKLVDRYGVFDKMALNFGIKVNFPGYVYQSTFTYDDHNAAYPDGVQVDEQGSHTWLRPENFLQEVGLGLAFSFTPNVILDANLGVSGKWETQGRVLLSIKHNGPKAAAAAAE